MASTGAMELLANRKHGIQNPVPYGPYDLAESYLIHAPLNLKHARNMYEATVLKFQGQGVHISDWPFHAWSGDAVNRQVWDWRDSSQMRKLELPQIETVNLFVYRKHATGILDAAAVEAVKQALWDYKSPILINYVDDYFWHVALIVGYDDELAGTCYEISAEECGEQRGSFYVRDSFGVPLELRDYDWFRLKGNAAIVVKEID
jgi:hypothetical protein